MPRSVREPSAAEYRRFLPVARRAVVREPERTWWRWGGHDVHLARIPRPQAPVRLLVVHGAGGHSGAVWPLAEQLAGDELDVTAVDLPLYGRTVVADPSAVRYEDWVRLLVDLVEAEHDDRPLILFGASIGGLLAHEVAVRSPRVTAVAATCLMDPRSRAARARMTRFGRWGVAAGPLCALVRGPLARLRIPVRWVADLSRMSRDRGLAALCARDPRGGGALVPLGFLASYLRFRHTPPARSGTPVVLVQPARDTWTPAALSLPALEGRRGPARVVMLRECGHFPVEEPGLTDLVRAVRQVAAEAGVA